MFKGPKISCPGLTGLIILAFAAMLTTACGFRPLYGTRSADLAATEQYLAQIQISQIPDRLGQQLRNSLLPRLTPKGEPANPKYVLNITTSESIASLGVKKTAVVTRGNLTLNAAYSLQELGSERDDASLASGSVQAISSYDIPQAEFTARIALKDARARAIREIADDIKIRLGVYFRQAAE